MPLLEEVHEGADDSAGDAESLKAAHRRKRSKGANAKGKKKKKTEVKYYMIQRMLVRTIAEEQYPYIGNHTCAHRTG